MICVRFVLPRKRAPELICVCALWAAGSWPLAAHSGDSNLAPPPPRDYERPGRVRPSVLSSTLLWRQDGNDYDSDLEISYQTR